MNITHETLAFDRTFAASGSRLFAAYTDPREREIWSAPTPDTVIVIDKTDVRTGGRETARCGTKDDLPWTMQVVYHSVETDRHIVFTEELWEADRVLTIALITFDFQENESGGTRLILTDQIVSFVGAGGVGGHREGYEKALDNLAARLRPA